MIGEQEEEAVALAARSGRFPLKIDLIDVNDATGRFRPPEDAEVPGHYVLESVGGKPLPWTDDPSRGAYISWGQVILNDEGSQGTCFYQLVQLAREVVLIDEFSCVYMREGAVLTLVSSTPGEIIIPSEWRLERDRLIRPSSAGDFLYRRVTLSVDGRP